MNKLAFEKFMSQILLLDCYNNNDNHKVIIEKCEYNGYLHINGRGVEIR